MSDEAPEQLELFDPLLNRCFVKECGRLSTAYYAGDPYCKVHEHLGLSRQQFMGIEDRMITGRAEVFAVGDPRNVPGYGESDDPVTHPAHYNTGGIEVIDAITEWGLCFRAGNVVKYVARYKHKHKQRNKQIEDLRKARFYLDHLIAGMESA